MNGLRSARANGRRNEPIPDRASAEVGPTGAATSGLSTLTMLALTLPLLLAAPTTIADAGRADAGRADAGRAEAGHTDAGRTEAGENSADGLYLPWREAGLTERQAAAHLLDRFAHGPRPGHLDALVEMGLEEWLTRQLANDFDNPGLDQKLERLRSLELSTREMDSTYPQPSALLRQAQRQGVIEDPSAVRRDEAEAKGSAETPADRERMAPSERRKVMEWARDQGYRPAREATGELMVQKLARAVYSDNQLQEVMTDFWFNHFNVSITDNQARIYVWPYERDAIRPFVFGDFRDMLEATAKHPAMLHYLDNVRSGAEDGADTTFDRGDFESRRRGRLGRRGGQGFFGAGSARMARTSGRPAEQQRRRAEGLNENYARELMELHTLGVDGGYSQDDVVEVARAFTGWSTYPPEGLRPERQRMVDRLRGMPESGFVFEESFLFRADVHDAEEKTVLGHRLAPGRGLEDGLEVLDILAAHPSTAKHLAHKMAVRFVSDQPSQELEERLAEVFSSTGGDLGAMVKAIAESPEFWSTENRSTKIKSPFELTVTALRTTGAQVDDPRALIEWISRMGQPLYAYQAPTGYPDTADAWVSSGSLLARMNFGLQFATGRIPGVRLDLESFDQGREPESIDEALRTWVPRLLPERDGEQTIARLEPIVRDPDLARKIAEAAPESSADGGNTADDWELDLFGAGGGDGRRRAGFDQRRPRPPIEPDSSTRAQVVGVILGSPSFQRR